MIEDPKLKVVIDGDVLLTEFSHLRQMMAEYDTLLNTDKPDDEWNKEALSLVRKHQQRLNLYNHSFKTVELVRALLREMLNNLKTDELQFRLDGDTTFSSSEIHHPEEAPLLELTAYMNTLARHAPLAMQERIRFLLFSILVLFKQITAGDVTELEESIDQINLLTSTRDSQNLVREIAMIARDIYNSLNMLSEGLPLDSLNESSEGMSEAVRKLKGVISGLEDAAMTNLDSLDELTRRAREDETTFDHVLEGLRESQQMLGEIKTKSPAIAGRIANVQEILSEQVGSALMEMKHITTTNQQTYLTVVGNQSFQDLTGQALKKIITFVEGLEMKMIKLLQRYKPVLEMTKEPQEAKPVDKNLNAIKEQGPKQSQDQVDSLLADLGF